MASATGLHRHDKRRSQAGTHPEDFDDAAEAGVGEPDDGDSLRPVFSRRFMTFLAFLAAIALPVDWQGEDMDSEDRTLNKGAEHSAKMRPPRPAT